MANHISCTKALRDTRHHRLLTDTSLHEFEKKHRSKGLSEAWHDANTQWEAPHNIQRGAGQGITRSMYTRAGA